ncbi:hypothetical protein Uis1B_1894 [Bifidobacterium margollesii]|uniref:Uncharacterized protein n=1 Tax=Bifidobacterium margollesii TaxID=2020964 RepID=A0A2N5J7P3_9BIFI|nr:hypothetical protein [Bifidobacterium margollesii]PLS30224.1 hypothetical protein Uis1B_1894 [Bifidobacterium margollesii]
MPIAPDRLDKFTFMAGQGRFITDPEVIKRINKLTGFVPPTPEEQAYIAEQWEKRFDVEDDLSTDKLRAEYAHKKALGEL